MFSWCARMVAGSRRRSLVTLAAWVLIATALPLLAPKLGAVEDNRSVNDPPAYAESLRARALDREAFPDQRGTPALVVLRNPRGLGAAGMAEVRRVTSALAGPRRPAGVGGAVSVTNAPERRDALLSPDGTTAVIVVPISGSPSDRSFLDTVDAVRAVAGRGAGDLAIRVTGPAGITRDAIKVFGSANLPLLAGTLVLVLALLLLIYRSPVLAVIPLIGVGVAIRVTDALGAALVKAGAFGVSSQAASIMTVLLFGVGTDYGLFLISRYRQELGDGTDRTGAMRVAITRVGGTLLSSAVTVIAAVLALLLADLPALRGFGPFLALSVAVMFVVGTTLVPALVVLAGRAAFWPRAARGPERPAGSALWRRVAAVVLGRPRTVVAMGLAVLALLSTGLVGYTVSYDFLTGFRAPTDSRDGQRMLAAAFAPGRLAPASVLVRTAAPLGERPGAVDRVVRAVAAVDGVQSVTGPVTAADGRTARIGVVYRDDPYGDRALDRTARLRTAARSAVRGSGLPEAEVLVGGESALALDLRGAEHRDLRLIGPVVLILIAAVLAVVLRSLVAPLHLIATTVASVAATLGLTVAVLVGLFGDDGIGNRDTVYIFVFLVALGVDYNILLMSRVREETARSGHAEGLRTAVVRTGGVISSAGVILAATFTVLMTQPIRELFQFGFAMAAGLLLDTFLVRGALVPAIVRLLGRWNWWPGRPSAPRPRAGERSPASAGG